MKLLYEILTTYLYQIDKYLPSSLNTNESVWTFSENLYVSQHTNTGTFCALAISATCDVPTRDITQPFANTACAPRKTLVISLIIYDTDWTRIYVVCIPA